MAGNFANWKGCGAMAMIGHGMLWHDMPYYGMLWHVGNSQNCPPFVYLPHIHCLIWLHIVFRIDFNIQDDAELKICCG